MGITTQTSLGRTLKTMNITLITGYVVQNNTFYHTLNKYVYQCNASKDTSLIITHFQDYVVFA